MTVVDASPHGPAAVPDPDELAAIVAVLEALEEPAPADAKPPRSRWREAARSFEAGLA
jgi:hypothetical protein